MRAAFMATFGVAGALVLIAIGVLLVLVLVGLVVTAVETARARRDRLWRKFQWVADFQWEYGDPLNLLANAGIDERSIRSLWWRPYLVLPVARDKSERFRVGEPFWMEAVRYDDRIEVLTLFRKGKR